MFFLKVLATSLQDLLDYEGDVENDLLCTFTIGYTDMFGSSITKELKENGGKITVNNDNRRVTNLLLNSLHVYFFRVSYNLSSSSSEVSHRLCTVVAAKPLGFAAGYFRLHT